MTRGQLITVVSAKLGLDSTVASDERALTDRWANESVVEVLLRTHCYTEIGDMALTAGVSEYRTDDDVLALQNDRVSSSTRSGTFEVVTLEEMIARQSANVALDRSGVSVVAYEGNLLIVHPTPGAGESIRYFYVPRPTPMTDDAHDPSTATYGGIPTEYHKALEYYMLWQGAEYDDKRAAMGPQDYNSAFEGLCKEYRKRHRQKAQRGLRPSRVGYPGRRYGRRNDVYPNG